jgi:hypothetical protein
VTIGGNVRGALEAIGENAGHIKQGLARLQNISVRRQFQATSQSHTVQKSPPTDSHLTGVIEHKWRYSQREGRFIFGFTSLDW